MTPNAFVEELSKLSFPSTFNPYAELCPIHDAPDAVEVRRGNLVNLLSAAIENQVEALWVARDLGYRGGRRTGIPLTDETHLSDASELLGGAEFQRATLGAPLQERTASVVWQVLRTVGAPVMLWNVFPLHPFSGDDQLTNRCHNRKEREASWPFLIDLVRMLAPKRVFAIGRDAQLALQDLDIEIVPVRHPSYGGQNEFIDTVLESYGISRSVYDSWSGQLCLDGLGRMHA